MQLAGADAEDEPPHPPEPAERQLQPDREEQHDDAELRERLDRMGVADRDVVEPGRPVAELAEPERPDQDADQDEADDRADPDPREGGNDDPGRAQDDERVGKAGGAEVGRARHIAFMQQAALLSAA